MNGDSGRSVSGCLRGADPHPVLVPKPGNLLVLQLVQRPLPDRLQLWEVGRRHDRQLPAPRALYT